MPRSSMRRAVSRAQTGRTELRRTGFTGALNKQATQSALGQALPGRGHRPGGQFRRDGSRSQPPVPQRVGVARPDDPEAGEHIQCRADGPGMATGPLISRTSTPSRSCTPGPSSPTSHRRSETWNNEHATMDHVGYKVLYDPSLPPSTSDFTANVVAMKNAGVEILFLEQEPGNYASAVIRDLDSRTSTPSWSWGRPLTTSSGGQLGRTERDRRGLSRTGGVAVPGRGPGSHSGGGHVQYLGAYGGSRLHPDFFTLLGWLSGSRSPKRSATPAPIRAGARSSRLSGTSPASPAAT